MMYLLLSNERTYIEFKLIWLIIKLTTSEIKGRLSSAGMAP